MLRIELSYLEKVKFKFRESGGNRPSFFLAKKVNIHLQKQTNKKLNSCFTVSSTTVYCVFNILVFIYTTQMPKITDSEALVEHTETLKCRINKSK